MAGRPIGTTKDSSRKRVINPNGRKIDYEPTKLTSAYMKWIKQGYKLTSDETRLVFDRNFNPETVAIRQRGRPKSVITSGYEKVKNPDSGREIKTNTQYFRKLAKKYGYDEENNRFLMYITDPRNADKKIVKNDETFKKYTEKHGYIYDEKENSFSIPSQKSAEALNSGMKCYELKIQRMTRNFINIYKYKPLRARGFIILPDKINNKKATINIQNKDDRCFIYCLGRKFDPNPESKNLERVSKHLKKTCCDLGFDKIKTPVTVKDIPKIEKEYNIAINLFGHNDGEIFPILTNKKVVDENKHIDLLVTSREDEHHYVWIKNFNKLFSQQTKHHGKKYFCKNCIQCFSSVEVLEKHNPNCIVLNGTQKIELPKEGSNLEFKSLNKTITVPFVIYADLEALLKPLKKCENIKNDNESYTIKTHEHKTCSYGHKVVCYEDDKYSKPYRMFRGKDAIYNFFEALFEEEKQIDDYMKEFYKSKIFLTQDD